MVLHLSVHISLPLTQSGSLVGHLVGGVALSNANPFPISDAGGTLTVDGTVTSNQGTAAALSAPWPVLIVSGSDPVGTETHPTWITGSVYVLNQGGAGSNVTSQSGSVTGLLVGGVSISNANPVPISDAGGTITVDGAVTVASTVINTGSITGLLVGGVALSNANPIPISDAGGVITVDGTVTVASTVINTGSITGLLVGGQALSNANPVPISDAGGTITVDGSVTATVASTVINSGSVTGLLVGGVAVSDANRIPISDGGGAITVDGTVTVSAATIPSGSVIGLLQGGQAVSNAIPIPISDAGGAITVDGTVTATVASTVIKNNPVSMGRVSRKKQLCRNELQLPRAPSNIKYACPRFRTAPLWRGDIGDLVQANTSVGSTAGNALIWAAENRSEANDHGLLVTCLDGRMILQTFRSHEYQHNDMVALWQNYIYQALNSHFIYTQASLPTPVATYFPTSVPEAPIPQGPTPGPDYTLSHACGADLTARLVETPDYRRDLFEHHASGTFVILRLELVNQSTFPIQIWDQDYSLQEEINGKQVNYTPHVAATGYLYIERPSNLYQDLIQPGEIWRTSLAFDVPAEGQQRRLVIRPGSEFNQQVCQVSIPMRQPLKLDYVWAALCMLGAVYFIFRDGPGA